MKFFENRSSLWVAVATLGLGFASTTQAGPITPDIIFGSGNANGSFTVTNTELSFPNTRVPISGNIELGLRAKLRYDASGSPQNQFNWDGADTYTFSLANGNPPANRAMWNYEWSVNIADVNAGTNQATIPQLVEIGSLVLSYDTDPGSGTTFSDYNVFDFDAYYGTNTTPNGGGTYDNTGTPVSGSTVAQNSVNYGFLPGAPLGAGLFDIKLTAFNLNGAELASTRISVDVSPVAVPEPGTLALLGLGLTGLVYVRRRRS